MTIPEALRSVVVWSFENDDGGYDSGGIVAEGSPAPWGPSLMASAQRLDEAPSSPLIAAFGRR